MDGTSTISDVRTTQRNRFGVVGRRIALSALLLLVVVGATGVLGVRARTAHASSDGYDLSLTYPHIARAGLDIPWRLRLRHPGGFDGPITVAISRSYFDLFEFQGMHPSPSDETGDGKFVYLTFPPPASDLFVVTLDTYVQPAAQLGKHAETAVSVKGQRVGDVRYTTWLVP